MMLVDLPKIYTSLEVVENRELHRQAPDLYYLARTEFLWCECQKAAMVVIAKDAEFMKWTCYQCVK